MPLITPMRSRERPPSAVRVAAISWVVVALICVGKALLATQERSSFPGLVGQDVVAGSNSTSPATAWFLVALVLLVLDGVLLYGGQGWAAYGLALVVTGVVLALSVEADLAAVLAMACMVLGTVPLATVDAQFYLARGSSQ